MFVYYYALAGVPLEVAEQALAARLDRLEGWAGEAYRNGERIAAEVKVGPGPLTKHVELRVWPVARAAGVVTMRLAWTATGVPRLFPELDADLVLARLGPDLTQVSLRGSYRPPLGRLGTMIDRAVMHRVAEASVKEFVDRIVAEIAVESAGSASR